MDVITAPATTTEARIALHGRFDAHECPSLSAWVDARIGEGITRLSVDLSDVTFIDSTALAVLVRGMKHARAAGGDLALIRPSQTVRVILELTRLDRAFVIRGATIKVRADA
ncbi:MAG: STAS domain-containing protein [Chloroflexota bacterium]